MEMQVDDEWPLNIIIAAPPHLVSSLTSEADVASMEMIPATSYTPGDGNYKQITDNGGRWIYTRPADNLTDALNHDLGIVLIVSSEDELNGLDDPRFDADNVVIAIQIDCVSRPDRTHKRAAAIRSSLPEQCRDAQILVSGSFEHGNLTDYMKCDDISGFLFLDASFPQILEFIDTFLK